MKKIIITITPGDEFERDHLLKSIKANRMLFAWWKIKNENFKVEEV